MRRMCKYANNTRKYKWCFSDNNTKKYSYTVWMEKGRYSRVLRGQTRSSYDQEGEMMDLNVKKQHKEALEQFNTSFKLAVEQNDHELIHDAQIGYKLKKDELLRAIDSFFDEEIKSLKKGHDESIRPHDEKYYALISNAQRVLDAAIQAAKEEYELTTTVAKKEHKNKTRSLIQVFEKQQYELEKSRSKQKDLTTRLFKTQTVSLRDKHNISKINNHNMRGDE